MQDLPNAGDRPGIGLVWFLMRCSTSTTHSKHHWPQGSLPSLGRAGSLHLEPGSANYDPKAKPSPLPLLVVHTFLDTQPCAFIMYYLWRLVLTMAELSSHSREQNQKYLSLILYRKSFPILTYTICNRTTPENLCCQTQGGMGYLIWIVSATIQQNRLVTEGKVFWLF